VDINDLLASAVASGASDLHLKVGSYPMMRLHGTLAGAAPAAPSPATLEAAT